MEKKILNWFVVRIQTALETTEPEFRRSKFWKF